MEDMEDPLTYWRPVPCHFPRSSIFLSVLQKNLACSCCVPDLGAKPPLPLSPQCNVLTVPRFLGRRTRWPRCIIIHPRTWLQTSARGGGTNVVARGVLAEEPRGTRDVCGVSGCFMFLMGDGWILGFVGLVQSRLALHERSSPKKKEDLAGCT